MKEMRHRRYMQRSVLLALCSLLCLAVVAWAEEASFPAAAAYQRDAKQPLKAEVKTVEETAEQTTYHVLFESKNGERVPALFSVPKSGKAPYPVLIMQHGLGGSKSVEYVQAAAMVMLKAGYCVLRMDAYGHGERKGGTQPPSSAAAGAQPLRLREGWIQSIVDFRRGIDFLETRPEIDRQRIGYWGVSMGAMQGAILCGVDQRVKASVLIIGGSLPPAIVQAAEPPAKQMLTGVDPATFAPFIAPRPVLMLNGKQDNIIRPEQAQKLYDCLGQPKEIKWYDTGHFVPPAEAMKETQEFFAKHLARRE